jgi:hypothetical protein
MSSVFQYNTPKVVVCADYFLGEGSCVCPCLRLVFFSTQDYIRYCLYLLTTSFSTSLFLSIFLIIHPPSPYPTNGRYVEKENYAGDFEAGRTGRTPTAFTHSDLTTWGSA